MQNALTNPLNIKPMYALLISPVNQLPTVVSMLSDTYVDLTFAGYTLQQQGTKKRMEELYKEEMENFVDELELNDQND